MKKIIDIKKGKIALISFFVMLFIAAYINYRYDPLREENLGKTIYVNSDNDYIYDKVSIYEEENKNEEISSISTNQNNNTDEIAVFRYERDNMYSEIIENYQIALKNEKTSKEKNDEYQEKLNELLEQKNLISFLENTLALNQVEDIAIIPYKNNTITVMVKLKIDSKYVKDELEKQIKNTVSSHLNINKEDINIEYK